MVGLKIDQFGSEVTAAMTCALFLNPLRLCWAEADGAPVNMERAKTQRHKINTMVLSSRIYLIVHQTAEAYEKLACFVFVTWLPRTLYVGSWDEGPTKYRAEARSRLVTELVPMRHH